MRGHQSAGDQKNKGHFSAPSHVWDTNILHMLQATVARLACFFAGRDFSEEAAGVGDGGPWLPSEGELLLMLPREPLPLASIVS